jgi:RNA polymerase sigma-70 factor, ECF subfamily
VDWQSAAEGAQPTTSRFEDSVALGELIKTLDDDRREAFVLTQHLGLSYAEAAKVCDCPVGTIRSRVARARNDLITSMEETSHQQRSVM